MIIRRKVNSKYFVFIVKYVRKAFIIIIRQSFRACIYLFLLKIHRNLCYTL